MKQFSKIIIILLLANIFILPVKAANFSEAPNISTIITSLLQYVKFKNNPNGKITLCLLGINSIKVESGDNIILKQYPKNSEIKMCDAAYISESEQANIEDILWKLKKNNIFTISPIRGFAQMGGVIQLSAKNEKLYFLVNISAAKKTGNVIDSDLLSISELIDY